MVALLILIFISGKMNYKKNLLFYYILKLKEIYIKINSDIKLNRNIIYRILFINVIKSNSLLDIFDNFYALPKWPVEADCFNIILEKWNNFENIINNLELLKEEIILPIRKEEKDIIDLSITKLPYHIFIKDENYLKEYIFSFSKSFNNSYERALYYLKEWFKIYKYEILNDKLN